jgi:hypothetical protein
MAQASEHSFSRSTDIHQRVSEGTNKLAEQAEHTTEELKTAAIERVNRTRESAMTGLRQQRDQLRERALRIGGVLHQSGEQLRAEEPGVARYIEIAAQRMERAADYVSKSDVRGLVADAERLARTQPVMFFGGVFLLGLAAGRFLKSSSASGAAFNDPNAMREEQ